MVRPAVPVALSGSLWMKRSKGGWALLTWSLLGVTGVLAGMTVLYHCVSSSSSTTTTTTTSSPATTAETPFVWDPSVIRVVSASSSSSRHVNPQEEKDGRRSHVYPQQRRHMQARVQEALVTNESKRIVWQLHSEAQQRAFLVAYGTKCSSDTTNLVLQRYNSLHRQPHLQVELWKYCALFTGYAQAYMDPDSVVLLHTFSDLFLTSSNNNDPPDSNTDKNIEGTLLNAAILVEPPPPLQKDDDDDDEASDEGTEYLVHGSFLVTSSPSVAQTMLQLLMTTSVQVFESSPLLLSHELYRVIQQTKVPWMLLHSKCVELAQPSTAFSSVHPIPPRPKPAILDADADEEILLAEPRYLSDMQRLQPLPHQSDASISLLNANAGDTPDAISKRLTHHCPVYGGFCCSVYKYKPGKGGNTNNVENTDPVILLRDPILPHETTSNDAPPPLAYLDHVKENGGDHGMTPKEQENMSYKVLDNQLAYMSTIRTKQLVFKTESQDGTEQTSTPNFFEILLMNDCLPTQKACHKCLKSTKGGGGNCDKCADVCFCYCKVLCNIRPPPKRVVKELIVTPPRYKLDSNRLVPRIVHQTWFEPVTPEKYPNMSRLIESFKQSGWEYNFYDDDMAAEFLSTHFPSEVRDAYDAIIPGAFKADLFRYCVLLIRGGVYADMDVLLEVNLDEAVAPDVGFMTPIDEPGIKVGHRSCLWNGLLAVAPGHPFLAKTIELVVNNIRNRFTSVDYDDMLCPDPVLSVSHSVDTLFTCGPCILGAAINKVLGRHMQDEFEVGDVDIWARERLRQEQPHKSHAKDGQPLMVHSQDPRLLIPGRTIILQQDKQDMGAHRFTWVERNIMVAATDMPNYDDRPPSKEHYSKTHEKVGVYGLKKLYKNNISADEELRIIVQKV